MLWRDFEMCLTGVALIILLAVAVLDAVHVLPSSSARSEAPQSPERPGLSVDSPAPQRSAESQEQGDDAETEQPSSVPTLAVQRPNEPAGGNGDAPDAKQHQEDDLIAQQTMAKAAEKMLELTFAQIVLGVIGAFGLIITLGYNIRATNAAVRTAEANRAWMSLAQTTVTERKTEEQTILVITMEWTNSGLSPALDCRIFRDHKPIDMIANIPTFRRPASSEVTTIAPIGNDRVAIASPITVSENDYRRFLSREVRIFIYCIVLYRDVYPNTPERHTEFCGELRYLGDRQTGDGPILRDFVLTPSGKQNTAS